MSIFKSAFGQLGQDVGRLQPFNLETYYPRIQLQPQTTSQQQISRVESQPLAIQPAVSPPVIAQQGNNSLGTALMIFVPIVGMPFSSSAFRIPRWANPLAPPPLNAMPKL